MEDSGWKQAGSMANVGWESQGKTALGSMVGGGEKDGLYEGKGEITD